MTDGEKSRVPQIRHGKVPLKFILGTEAEDIAEALSTRMTRWDLLGRYAALSAWAWDNAPDGLIPGNRVTVTKTVHRVCDYHGHSSLVEAWVAAGWLAWEPEGLRIVDAPGLWHSFAKQLANSRSRMQRYRERQKTTKFDKVAKSKTSKPQENGQNRYGNGERNGDANGSRNRYANRLTSTSVGGAGDPNAAASSPESSVGASGGRVAEEKRDPESTSPPPPPGGAGGKAKRETRTEARRREEEEDRKDFAFFQHVRLEQGLRAERAPRRLKAWLASVRVDPGLICAVLAYGRFLEACQAGDFKKQSAKTAPFGLFMQDEVLSQRAPRLEDLPLAGDCDGCGKSFSLGGRIPHRGAVVCWHCWRDEVLLDNVVHLDAHR